MAILETKRIILNGRSLTINADDPRVLLCDTLKEEKTKEKAKPKAKQKARGK